MKNIILCGFMGSGKSVVGRLLADKLGLSFYDTDELVEEKCQMKISDIFRKHPESYFRKMETEVLKGFLNTENNIIALGGGLAANKANHSILKECGFTVLLDCEIEKILQRISGDESRPLTAEGTEGLKNRYQDRKPIYESVADTVVYSGETPEKACQNLIRLLEEFEII